MDKDEFTQVVKQFSQDDGDLLSTPKFISQQSVGARKGYNVQQWTYEVDAVNELSARIRTRAYVRRNHPTVENIITPDITDVESTEQGTFRDFFPETFQQQRYTISVLVVK